MLTWEAKVTGSSTVAVRLCTGNTSLLPTDPAPPLSPHTVKGIMYRTHLINDLDSEHVKNSQTSVTTTHNPMIIWAKDMHRHFTRDKIPGWQISTINMVSH